MGTVKSRYVKKLNPGSVMDGTIGVRSIPSGQTAVDLFRVAGIVRGVRIGEAQIGQFVEFSGDFFAMNLTNGELVSSDRMIMPGITEPLRAALVESKGAGIQFSYVIGIKKSETNGYDYTAKAIEKPMLDDAVSALIAKHFADSDSLSKKAIAAKSSPKK